MARQVFPQNVIAVIWDFDKTLIPGYMQTPLFEHYGIDAAEFWAEADGLVDFYRSRGHDLVATDTLYLNWILTYVRHGRMPGLDNRLLRELGGRLHFYEGIPEFLINLEKSVESRFAEHHIQVEHYVISSGLRQMILGSAVAPMLEGVWGCEFAEEVPEPGYLESSSPRLFSPDTTEIREVIYTIDNTTKTRAIFEINKGTNKNPAIDVNASIPHEDRRVPFRNMVYIADGPSDVPVFSIVKQNGGRTYAVYRPGSEAEFAQTKRLLEQGRVDAFGPADYTEGSQTALWITHTVEEIADRIVADRERALAERLGPPPGHLDG
jgi:hypothetical protein